MSDVKISKAQLEYERTPSEPIPHESVQACELGFPSMARILLTIVSFPCPWNKGSTRAELWHVVVGQDCKGYCEVAVRKRDELLPQGCNTSQYKMGNG